ncbi:PD-(D/E)XK nuclease superfamily protein [Pontibacter sp. SGAir0037]|uniref:PD-(D/E)XK nuclease superfamily protein n=1 Tax=Pontibacter sp. SGAir0037 TaxID=2571030 RepID=UPI0010CD1679|nr:PD-(D/E)XK nuclease superfamily protein [Pontibacter sp. SGAir0037]QCR22854.1 hypothetical protein C1N53_11205 [Pontibacter sp. SGAir0037]
MIKGGVGGANTTTGLVFEQKTSLESAITKIDGYRVVGSTVYKENTVVGTLLSKGSLYTKLLKPRGIDYKTVISKKLLPDDAYLNHTSNTLYIIEKKYQQGAGSVDEKLQTADFKIKQYRKLLAPLNIEVEFIYVLNDWYLQECYSDVLQYITDVGCSYYFGKIPVEVLGLGE